VYILLVLITCGISHAVYHNAQFKTRKIKIVVRERGGRGVDWVYQAQDRDEW